MSKLKQQISTTMKSAMRAKNKVQLGCVRMILAEIKRIEIDQRIELDDAQVLACLDKMSKQRRDSISQFEEANRHDLAAIEKKELEIIQQFLPQPLISTEIQQLVADAISNCQAQSMQDMGKIMAQLKPQVQGRADISEVSKLVKEQLSS